MAEAKKPGSKKIIDVSHPGQTAPAKTSRSIIVTNRPIMKDPMVVDEEAETPAPDKQPPSKIRPKLGPESQPSAATPETSKPDEDLAVAEPKTPTKTTDEALAAKTAAEDKPDKTSVEPEPSKTKTKEPEEPKKVEAPEQAPDEQNDSEAANDEAAPPPPDDKALEAAAAEEAKHQAAIDKLAESKQYYLPINTIEKRRSRRFVMLGIVLSVLLALAWADVALDAGIIQINGVKPVTHFFSN